MLKVSVTGNIGSGKSTVSKVFERLGIPVFYADPEARALYDDPAVLNKIVQQFGENILTSDRKLDKKALANIIFSDKDSLTFINSLIHPAVGERFLSWAATMEKKGNPMCIHEAALTFESGSYKLFDKIIVVHAPEDVLLQRVEKRDNLTREQALERLKNQFSQQDKISRADYLISNNGNELVLPQIISIYNQILALQTKVH